MTPILRDYHRRLSITGLLDPLTQGNVVTNLNGVRMGTYYDDSMPRQEYYISLAVEHRQNNDRIWASVPMARYTHRFPDPVITLVEYYPVQAGFVVPPIAEILKHVSGPQAGVIAQQAYPGYLWDDDPANRDKLKPLTPAMKHHIIGECLPFHPGNLWTF